MSFVSLISYKIHLADEGILSGEAAASVPTATLISTLPKLCPSITQQTMTRHMKHFSSPLRLFHTSIREKFGKGTPLEGDWTNPLSVFQYSLLSTTWSFLLSSQLKGHWLVTRCWDWLKNTLTWSLARWTREISDLKAVQLHCKVINLQELTFDTSLPHPAWRKTLWATREECCLSITALYCRSEQ